METKEEVTTHILKGKRTKRQRVQSPFPFALTTNSPIEDEGCENNFNDHDKKIIDSNNVSSPISTNSNHLEGESEIQVKEQDQEQENEEEDMANCLILLSQGVYSRDTTNQYHNNVQTRGSNIRFTSKKFLETGSNASGKSGYYVYECKTCYKTFPSFQALGGHRASHKKPKAIINNYYNDGKHYIKPALSFDDEDRYYKNISSLSLQLSYDINKNNNKTTNNNNNFVNTNKTKMHECATCGAEFTSGQALGGHMRRHRTMPIVGVSSSTNLCLTSPTIEATETEEEKRGRDELSLSLDLNLPAPEDDKFSFPSKEQNQPQQPPPQPQQQQQDNKLSLGFSNPALVDCHY